MMASAMGVKNCILLVSFTIILGSDHLIKHKEYVLFIESCRRLPVAYLNILENINSNRDIMITIENVLVTF